MEAVGRSGEDSRCLRSEPVHFLQIWIEPAKDGLPATYEQLAFSPEEKQGKWKQLAGPVKTPGVSDRSRCLFCRSGSNRQKTACPQPMSSSPSAPKRNRANGSSWPVR